jgi:hypothetical protein
MNDYRRSHFPQSSGEVGRVSIQVQRFSRSARFLCNGLCLLPVATADKYTSVRLV